MKIVKLTSENVKKLIAVEVTPEGSLVTIGGKNGAGKSSVLDSIAYALGGEKLVPAEPIRTGEREAKIVVDLGDYIVTRRFHRSQEHADGCASRATVGGQGTEHFPCDCGFPWSDTKSVLVVTNREGAKYPSPQVLLDKLYGRLTFDPLAFSKEKPQRQNEILRQLTNLDFSLSDAKRKTLFDTRTMVKKTLLVQETKLGQMTWHADAPPELISFDELSKEILKGRELQKTAEEAQRAADNMQTAVSDIGQQVAVTLATIEELERRLKTERTRLEELKTRMEAKQKSADTLRIVAEEAKAAVPDFEALDKKLKEIDAANTKVRANQAFTAQGDAVKASQAAVNELNKEIIAIDDAKQAAMSAAKFPVPGLGLTDDGVTFEKLALEDVSSSVQLRVSIAIGLALNPTLKVLLIRNGNLLDDDNLKQVAQQAEEAGAQVWMEYVTASAEGVSVMLEDGHLQG